MVAKPKKVSMEENVRTNYPEFSYLLDDPTLFGMEVTDVLKKATKLGWTVGRFKSAIMATPYWQNTVASAKQFDAATDADKTKAVDAVKLVISGIADLDSIPQAELDAFVTSMARSNVQGDALKKMTFQFAFTKGKATKAEADALASQDAADIRKTIKAYGGTATDDEIESYLTGGKKSTDIQRIYREKLKGQYPHLASQFDADLTLDDITKDYRTIAAQTLEQSADTIDFNKPEFIEAIAKRDDKGNLRQMSLGEWNQTLRTDDRYGYSKTTRAISDARKVAANIGRAFGKVS